MNRFIDIHTHNPAAKREDLIQIATLMVSGQTPQPPQSFFAAAVHPYSLAGFDITWIDRLNQIARHTNCVAIGETGLDFRSEYLALAKQQLAVMDEHIFIAQKLRKPLIIHSVKALPQTLTRLKHTSVPFIIHGFVSTTQAADEILNQGGYISLGKKITHDTELQQRVRNIDLSRILTETDDGNTPIEDIYAALASTKGIEIGELQAQIEANFKQIFPSIV